METPLVINQPQNLETEGVEIIKEGIRCYIVKYEGHYFLYSIASETFFAPSSTLQEIEQEFSDVEGNKG